MESKYLESLTFQEQTECNPLKSYGKVISNDSIKTKQET